MSSWEKHGGSNEYYTPKYIFDALGCDFDMDVAAPLDRSHVFTPARKFITQDSLMISWDGFVWMNPPFGGRGAKSDWLNKLHDHGSGIALTPDRSSTIWWQEAAEKCDIMMQINRRIRFIHPDGSLGGNISTTGTTLFAYGPKGIQALLNAHNNKLGLCFRHFKP